MKKKGYFKNPAEYVVWAVPKGEKGQEGIILTKKVFVLLKPCWASEVGRLGSLRRPPTGPGRPSNRAVLSWPWWCSAFCELGLLLGFARARP